MAGLTIGELEAALGIRRKVIHRWVAKGLLAKPVPKGPKTVYDEVQVLRLRAVLALRARRMPFDDIERWLHSATRDQIEALVNPSPPPPPSPARAPTSPVSQKWERAQLVPGLELHMSLDAPPVVRRLAREIFDRYSVLAGEGDEGAGPPRAAS